MDLRESSYGGPGGRAQAATEVDQTVDTRFANGSASQYFLVHTLQHRLASQRIPLHARKAEVHVERRTPCRVIRPGFGVVADQIGLAQVSGRGRRTSWDCYASYFCHDRNNCITKG